MREVKIHLELDIPTMVITTLSNLQGVQSIIEDHLHNHHINLLLDRSTAMNT